MKKNKHKKMKKQVEEEEEEEEEKEEEEDEEDAMLAKLKDLLDVEAACLAGEKLGFAAAALVTAATEKGWPWVRSALSPITLGGKSLGMRKVDAPDSNPALTCGEHNADGALHGWGLSLLPPGGWAWGSWSRGEQHGAGVRVYSDGSRYVGSWRAGLRHGRGVTTYPDGRVFDGRWSNDERHGEGTLSKLRGRERTTGRWNADNIDGPGVTTVCPCFDLVPDPVEQLKHHNESPALCRPFGFLLKARYEAGLASGLFAHYYCNGDIYDQHYDRGQHAGPDRFVMSPQCPDERFRGHVIEHVAWEHPTVSRADGSLTYVLSHPDPVTAPGAFCLYRDYYELGYLPVEDRDRHDISALLARAAERLPAPSRSRSGPVRGKRKTRQRETGRPS